MKESSEMAGPGRSISLASELKKIAGCEVLGLAEIPASYTTDFGHIESRTPAAVAFPSCAEQVVSLVRFAAQEGIPLAVRGEGHSQAGQSLREGGIILAMKSFNRILEICEGAAVCEGGAIWADLVDRALERGQLPPVLTNNLHVTIGGTLSTAGLGVSSFRHGTQADQCLELEVVTGSGDRLICSEKENPELFDAARSGLGQVAVITRATVRLRPARPMVRTYYLLYDQLESLMEDAAKLMEDGRMDFLEAWCSPCPQGFRGSPAGRQPFARWFFPLHASIEFEPSRPPDDASVLESLQPYETMHQEDLTARDFAFRMDSLFDLWKRSGYWEASHPWMEAILPWDAAAGCIRQLIQSLPPHLLGGGHILLWPARNSASHVPLFLRPNSERVLGFGILPGVRPEALHAVKLLLARASDACMAAGGKRYLSGWIEFDAERWQAHYGGLWERLRGLKRKYDPGNIFNPGWWPE